MDTVEQIIADGRTPHGVRGLKLNKIVLRVDDLSRTPHGVRGLKWLYPASLATLRRSHPSRGAWIEMFFTRCKAG